ncbi:hypothetical protein F511_38674 [Dorcoceras hygrometricum]|uniref:Uncharacterized protein n=1 Tax=Dorcoceras hygrometricum TaxID=472368 RepID=A0A2Z7B073_9LAMI|nr:hypothetical protein F511_38674 [Dorcoceras hygrometricum]
MLVRLFISKRTKISDYVFSFQLPVLVSVLLHDFDIPELPMTTKRVPRGKVSVRLTNRMPFQQRKDQVYRSTDLYIPSP